jgi:hypothetical protein
MIWIMVENFPFFLLFSLLEHMCAIAIFYASFMIEWTWTSGILPVPNLHVLGTGNQTQLWTASICYSSDPVMKFACEAILLQEMVMWTKV